MPARTLLAILSALAVSAVLAGCATDPPDETAVPTADPDLVHNDTSAMCVEGAEDCDDTPTMETVDDPSKIGT